MIIFPHGDNVLYEGIREHHQEETLIQEYQQFPRNAIQITGGAQHNEALEYAARFKRETLTKRVYYRFGIDDNIHQFETPDASAARLATYASRGLIPSYNNEPTKGTLTEVSTHAIQTMRELKNRLIQDVLMLNWNTGFIENLENQRHPELDEMYILMRSYGYTAGFHEYMNTRFLDDPNKPLYIGRHRYVTRRFVGLRWAISEFGFDSHLPNPQYDGYKNHATIWAQLFPGKSLPEVFWQEAKKADQTIYAVDGTETVLWFCRGHNNTSRWESYNFQFETDLINAKKVYGRNTMADWTTFDWGATVPNQKASITCSLINLRAAPSALAADVGDLHDGDVMTVWGNTLTTSNPLNPDTRYNWRKVQYPNQMPMYVAVICGLTFTPVVPPPPTSGLTQVQWDRLNIANNTVKIASAEIDKLLLEVKPPSSGGGF